MSVVRIPPELWERMTRVAVQATVASEHPVKESEIVVSLLRMTCSGVTSKQLVQRYMQWILQNNLVADDLDKDAIKNSVNQ